MCFALFMVMLDNTVVNVALPSIQGTSTRSLSSLEWTVNAYTLTFAVLLVTGGRLGDIFGRRKVFLFGVVIFAVASATIGFAPTDGWLVASRAVQGIGAALMMPGTLSIISNAFPPEERGRAIGTWAGVSAIALALGPLVGGWLTEDVTWRAIFFLNLPVAAGAVVVTLFAAARVARRDRDAPGRLSPASSRSPSASSALVLALVEGNAGAGARPRSSPCSRSRWSAWSRSSSIERRSPAPIVDFDFFRSRSFVGANIVAFIVSFAMLAMFFFLALYMQNILGFSPLEAGIRFLPSTLIIIVAGPIAGRLTDRIGPRPLMTAGLLVVSVSMYLAVAHHGRHELRRAAARLHPHGPRHGLVMSPMSTAAMNAVDRRKAGVASGHAVDVPDGRRHVRRRRARRAGRRGRPPRPRAVAAAGPGGGARAAGRRARLRRRASAARRPRSAAPRSAFVDALGTGLALARGIAAAARRGARVGR